MRQPDKVPALNPPLDFVNYIEWFWSARGFCGSSDNVLTPDILAQWSRHEYIDLQKWERDMLFGMDRAFRRSNNEVVSWHMRRKPVKGDNGRDMVRSKN